MTLLLNYLPIDIIKYISYFIQRTDQISLKSSNRFINNELSIDMSLNQELELYTKTIEQMDYAWKGDNTYIKIRSKENSPYSILQKYIIVTNLWYFDFNAEFDIYPDKYIIMFVTSTNYYKINLEFTGTNGIIIKSSHIPRKNIIEVTFQTKGKLKVNCREIDNLKHFETVQYIMCMPLYYYTKLSSSNTVVPAWKQQYIIKENHLTKMLYMSTRYFF